MKHTPQLIDNLLDRLIYTLMEYEQIAKPPNKGRVGKDLRLLREVRPFLSTTPDLLEALERLASSECFVRPGMISPETYARMKYAEAEVAKAKPRKE